MGTPKPAGAIAGQKKSISKSSAAAGRKDSHAVLRKRHKEQQSMDADPASGRLEKVYEERKHRVGRLGKITHLSKLK
jgi:hypothetical protein